MDLCSKGPGRKGNPPLRGIDLKQSRAERGQELGRNWGGARNVPDKSLKEGSRGRVEAGAGEE